MPNMEALISRISRKLADGPADKIWISKFDLDYAYGQIKLSMRAMDQPMHNCGNRWQLHRILPVPKRFLRAGRHTHNFSRKKTDQTLENQHPAWLDVLIVVTKGSKQNHMEELIDVLTQLEKAGYRLSKSKSELFKTEIEWIGHKIDQNGIRQLQDKLLAIKELKEPKNEKN